jgi:hypothetical protein
MSARHGVLRAAQMGAGVRSLMYMTALEADAKVDRMSARHGVLRAAQMGAGVRSLMCMTALEADTRVSA